MQVFKKNKFAFNSYVTIRWKNWNWNQNLSVFYYLFLNKTKVHFSVQLYVFEIQEIHDYDLWPNFDIFPDPKCVFKPGTNFKLKTNTTSWLVENSNLNSSSDSSLIPSSHNKVSVKKSWIS